MQSLFTSRKFWVTLLMLLVVILANFIPGFEMETEEAAGFAVVIVSYLVGVAVDPGPGGWRGVIKSRKFWAAAVGMAFVFLNAFQVRLPFEITPEMLVTIAVSIGGYIAGVAIEGTRPKPVDISLKNAVAKFDRDAIIREYGG